MEIPEIGDICAAYLCGDRDFLPMKCSGCHKTFCRHHIALDAHSCGSIDANIVSDLDAARSDKRERCAFHNCQKASMESVIVDTTAPEHRVVAVCQNCAGAFCAIHRHPSDHACAKIPTPPLVSQKNPEAHALLAKNFPPTQPSANTSTKPVKIPADPKKLARLRAVELMKMRHHAIPIDPKDKSGGIPITQRVHAKVIFNEPSPTEKTFWMRKTIGTGRAVDMIAEQFSIRISDTTRVHLEKKTLDSEESISLQNDKMVSEQIEDGETLTLVVSVVTRA
ncbi:hypothetical protein BU17DRAFT_51536 [Hysterangium stoloniferum]|nr:hypothetical protein BU17DRAFT_51536 [Hysterangium stoloniferum]